MVNLDTLVVDVLQEIAFQVIALQESQLGPPSHLAPLLRTCRYINGCLAFDQNPSLYARIFQLKFDYLRASQRNDRVTHADALANELRLRCTVLKQFRFSLGATDPDPHHKGLQVSRHQSLWTAYLMVLENEGKNFDQLRNWGRLRSWVATFLFELHGASSIRRDMERGLWPHVVVESRLAMWLFWLFDDLETFDNTAFDVLKIVSLGTHQYPICDVPWQNFYIHGCQEVMHGHPDVDYYGASRTFLPPSIVTPATMSFWGYVDLSHRLTIHPVTHPPLGRVEKPSRSDMYVHNDWEAEWRRTARPNSKSWVSGSLDGSWEGGFVFVDFSIYAEMQAGAPPSELEDRYLAQHEQLWTLREYYLESRPDTQSPVLSLSYGDPLRGFFPHGTGFIEKDASLIVREPSKPGTVEYSRWREDGGGAENLDTIVIGEGHSNWGSFQLRGRVRQADGFVCVVKQYNQGPRGHWIYRGYVAGHPAGHFVGRWRDTTTAVEEQGYEGCFDLIRRR